MKIFIFSRKKLEAAALKPFPANTAVISICDFNEKFATLKHKPHFLLQLSFDDVDNDIFIDELPQNHSVSDKKKIEEKYHMFKKSDAEKISSFYFLYKNDIDILICQCEHGQSRSAAVAAAILEFRTKNGINIFANDLYFPNKVVFRKTLEALRENSQ